MRAGRFLLTCVVALSFVARASAFEVDWVDVGSAGNAGFTRCTIYACPETVGGVPYAFRIARTEVTNAQYAEFLNAVAADDLHALYSAAMADAGTSQVGIVQSGSPGAYSYAPIAGREDMPVNHVSFAEAVRFANWLHNGQPSGPQDATTTEDGAYTITEQNQLDYTFARNPGALVFVPSQNEWIKAGYYDPTSSSFFPYATRSTIEPACSGPTNTSNRQNCDSVVGDLTPVGSYPGSTSPFGTLDQAGNVFEWTERRFGTARFVHGGSFIHPASFASSAGSVASLPDSRVAWYGFRVAAVLPEPGVGAGLIAGVLGLAGLRRRFRSESGRRPRVGARVASPV